MESYQGVVGSMRAMLPENFELLPEELSLRCVSTLLVNYNFKVIDNSNAEKKIKKFKDIITTESNGYQNLN